MKIVLNKLSLTYFKGIKSMSISFIHTTNIYGENAVGKTSIFDAFTWLFFGKDSTDRKDFEVKTLDESGAVIPKIEHEVSAEITIDGAPVSVKRVLKEKWVKKRGSLDHEFQGNETLYYWNDVPLQQQEFQAKINGIINETTFKLITNTLYFNTLKWQDRRNVLMQIAGNISDAEIVNGNKDFERLMVLLSGKTIQEYKAMVAARKKKLKDDLSAIPTRIDEINKNMPEPSDFENMRYEIHTLQGELDQIDQALQSVTEALKTKHKEITAKQTEMHTLNTLLTSIENSTSTQFIHNRTTRENEISNLKQQVRTIENTLRNNNEDIQGFESRKINLEKKRVELREKWTAIDSEAITFKEGEFACPACHRDFETGDIEVKKVELTNNFNIEKARRLAEVSSSGKLIATQIDGLNAKIKELTTSSADSKSSLIDLGFRIDVAMQENDRLNTSMESEVKNLLAANAQYSHTKAKIETLAAEIAATITVENNAELKARKITIVTELDSLKKQLTNEDRIKSSNARIRELQEEESKLAQQLADLEGTEFLIEKFTKAKMDMLVSRINGRFKIVKFKLFDTQINGGEVECCETLVHGVPFSDANNAAKINAGLDIINTLCEHHDVYAPIFIDNRESVNTLIECDSQVVNLIVSTDKKLRVA